MSAFATTRINPASLLAITALLFLLLVVLGLGRPAFAADCMKDAGVSSRSAGVTEPQPHKS